MKNPYPKPLVMPPAGHPRVYVTKDCLPRIKENLTKPQNQQAYEIHKKNLESASDGALPYDKPDRPESSNYESMIISIIESFAFEYLLTGDIKYGLRAIEMLRTNINRLTFRNDGYVYNLLGQIIFDIAIVYDWCHDLLLKDDMEFFYKHTIKMAEKMEVGWPPIRQGSVVGHGPEAQILRDLYGAGIAMYDEYPDVYLWAGGRYFSEFVPARIFMHDSHMLNQGSHYGAYRLQWDALSAFLSRAMGIDYVFGKQHEFCLYWALYGRRPDGHMLVDGDVSVRLVPKDKYYANYSRAMLHTGNYFGNPYLKWEASRGLPCFVSEKPVTNQSVNCVELLLLNDPDLAPKSPDELPLTKYFPSPKGGFIARTSWEYGADSNAVIAEMKINEWYFANHHHLDAGSFQIYYKGILATDSGYYGGVFREGWTGNNNGSTGYGSPHDINYNKRTVAHNAMLVYDPDEQFIFEDTHKLANDGGQALVNGGREPMTLDELFFENRHKVCDILGHEFGKDLIKPAFTYLKGDLTRAYSAKVSDYQRSFVFFNLFNDENPAALVVFDRIVSSNKDFKKSWLLHGLEEPEIDGCNVVFKNTKDNCKGKLTLDVLLPKRFNIEKIGGEGAEAFVDGVDYYAKTDPADLCEGGGYRVEVSPGIASEMDYFLNVMQVGEHTTKALPAQLIETEAVAGAVIADRVAIFSKSSERQTCDLEFYVPDGNYEILVADVAAGDWDIERNGRKICTEKASEDGGVVVFKGSGGDYRLRKKSS